MTKIYLGNNLYECHLGHQKITLSGDELEEISQEFVDKIEELEKENEKFQEEISTLEEQNEDLEKQLWEKNATKDE